MSLARSRIGGVVTPDPATQQGHSRLTPRSTHEPHRWIRAELISRPARGPRRLRHAGLSDNLATHYEAAERCPRKTTHRWPTARIDVSEAVTVSLSHSLGCLALIVTTEDVLRAGQMSAATRWPAEFAHQSSGCRPDQSQIVRSRVANQHLLFVPNGRRSRPSAQRGHAEPPASRAERGFLERVQKLLTTSPARHRAIRTSVRSRCPPSGDRESCVIPPLADQLMRRIWVSIRRVAEVRLAPGPTTRGKSGSASQRQGSSGSRRGSRWWPRADWRCR